jgi:hypothetical protein
MLASEFAVETIPTDHPDSSFFLAARPQTRTFRAADAPPLFSAAGRGHEGVVKLLLNAKADMESKNHGRLCPTVNSQFQALV